MDRRNVRSGSVLVVVASLEAACVGPGPDATDGATESGTTQSGSTSNADTTATDPHETGTPTDSTHGADDVDATTSIDDTASDTGEPDGPWPRPCFAPHGGSVCMGDGGVCGDGVLQSCEVCGGTKDEGGIDDGAADGASDTSECEIHTEPCDGEELGGETCSSIGYTGGPLACDGACTFDVRECESCLASPQVAYCRQPRVEATRASELELATDGETIAAAWLGEDTLGFARFDADLELLDTTSCMDPGDGSSLALARVPGGWLLAVGGVGDHPQLVLQLLADDGATPETVRTIADATRPVLVQRDDGWPVLVYDRTDFAASFATDVVAEQLADDGTAAWQAEVGTAMWADDSSAALSGTGVLVAVRSTEGDEDSLVVPIDGDGTVGTPQPLAGAFHLELATTALGAAGLWRNADEWLWGRFDGAGALASGEVFVGPRDPTTATQQSLVVAAGGRSFAAVTQGMRTELEGVHIDDDGSTVVEPYTLAIEPHEITDVAGVAVGDALVVGWIGHSPEPARARFVLARVAP